MDELRLETIASAPVFRHKQSEKLRISIRCKNCNTYTTIYIYLLD